MAARAIPDGVLAGERERLLAMVDILESVPLGDVRALARRSAFARLDPGDAVLVDPDEHGQRLLLLLEGRARVYEEGHPGRELTVSVVEGGTLVGATGFVPRRPWGLRVEALESSIICGVRRQAFEELVDRNPTLGTRVARLLGEPRYTHRQLATMIGANREAVTRAFGKLRSEGGVELRDRRIFVTDPEALKQTAQG